MQQSAHNLLAGLLVFLAAGALSNDLLDDSLLLDEEGADDPGESGQQHEKGNGEQMRSRVTRSQAAVSDSHKKDARKKLKRACRGEVSSTACAAAAAQKMNVLLPGAVHAQDATVCAGHGALTLLQPLGFLRADGLDTGELDAAVGLTAHGSSGLLGVVVGNEAASCRCK